MWYLHTIQLGVSLRSTYLNLLCMKFTYWLYWNLEHHSINPLRVSLLGLYSLYRRLSISKITNNTRNFYIVPKLGETTIVTYNSLF